MVEIIGNLKKNCGSHFFKKKTEQIKYINIEQFGSTRDTPELKVSKQTEQEKEFMQHL